MAPRGDGIVTALRPVAAPTDTADEHDAGPRCPVSDGPANVRWLRLELGTKNMPGVFLRGGKLVFVASVTDEGYITPLHPEEDNGPATVTHLSPLALSTRIGDHYRVEKFDGRASKWKPTHFPERDCARVMETVDLVPYVQSLNGVTHTPIARAGAGLLTEPGYDPASKYFLDPHIELDQLDTDPTSEQVESATRFLRRLVADFKWGHEDSEANFWGAMLTPLLRLATPPPYKLVMITARERGSGKSLLAELLRVVHGGTVSRWPGADDEVHKVISSKLHCTTSPVMQFDNVRGTLASGPLEALATSAVYDVRVLGSTNEVRLANDRLWVFTGNNLVIAGDLGRRMISIDIDPKMENPERRTDFGIKDLSDYVRSNRAKILHALLTWVAAWDSAGRPIGAHAADSFGRWTASVQAILAIAGIPGTFNDPGSEQESVANPEEMEWAEFLLAIRKARDRGRWTTRDLCDDMAKVFGQGDTNELFEALPAELHDKASKPGGPRSIKKSLGKWLSFRKGQWHGGLSVVQAGVESGTKSAYWSVVHRDDEPADDVERR